MRRLADDLSVKPMSLYSHFLNKESLLSSIKEGLFLAIAEELGPDDETASWSAQLRRVFEVVHHTCIEHPSFIPLLISTPMTPASEARANADRRTLIRAGFNAEETALALKALVAHLVGDSLIDYGRSDHGAIDVIETTRSDPATYFNFGLTVLLDGLEARLKNSIQ
jgi:AcrR family transcriptional regulator